MISPEVIIACVLLIFFLVGEYVISWIRAKYWLPVTAKLHHINWESREISAGIYGRKTTKIKRQAQCLYSFEFLNRKFYGIRASIFPIYSPTHPIYRRIMDSVVETRNGKTIEVFVNKRRPSNSVVSRDFDWDFLIFLGVLSVALVLLGFLLHGVFLHGIDIREVVIYTGGGVVIYAIMAWGRFSRYRKEMEVLRSIQPD